MPSKLKDLRFDQAANLVDDPANPKARIVLFKSQPSVSGVHVDSPDWKRKEATFRVPKAEQTAGQRNALPDGAFAAVWTNANGEKQRKLPYKHSDGSVDLGHLRNALARLSSTAMPAALKPKARSKLETAAAQAGVGDHKESAMRKRINGREMLRDMQRLQKSIGALRNIFKDADAEAEAGPLADWAGEEEQEGQHADSIGNKSADAAAGLTAMKAHAKKLGDAIAAYGDGAGLPADHPFHALKGIHKELCDKIAEAEAAFPPKKPAAQPPMGQESQAPPFGKEAEEGEGDEYGVDELDKDAEAGRVHKNQVRLNNQQVYLNKQLIDMQKRVVDAEKRATEAETIAKSERDLRELDAEKVTLRKFRHVPVDVDKEAAEFLKMRTTNKSVYDSVLQKMRAAEAIVEKSEAILRHNIGSPLAGAPVTAWKEIEAEAGKIVEKGAKGMTLEKAIDKVMRERTDLVKRYREEEAGRAQ